MNAQYGGPGGEIVPNGSGRGWKGLVLACVIAVVVVALIIVL